MSRWAWGVGAMLCVCDFWVLLLFLRLWEVLESLKGHVQICPMSVPLAEQSIFSGVCV